MRALIIDDESGNRLILKSILTKLNHQVDVFKCLADYQLVKEKSFDIIFLDWHLPNEDSLAFAEQLRLQNPNQLRPYIVMMTYNPDPADIGIAFQSGVNEHLSKPVSVSQVWARLYSAQYTLDLFERLYSELHNGTAHQLNGLVLKWFQQSIHETATPLSYIAIATDTVQKHINLSEHPKLKALCENVSKNVKLVRTILDQQLLRFGGLDPQNQVPVNLGELTREAFEYSNTLAEKSGVKIVYSAEVENAYIKGNYIEILQVLLNLINNGIDATVEAGKTKEISLSLKDFNDSWQICLRDGGYLDYQVESAVALASMRGSQKGDGHRGIGLTLSRKLIRSFKGTLEVGIKGNQTEFLIAFPKFISKD